MGEPFTGSKAVAAGRLTPYQLRSRYVAVYPGVHVSRGTELTARSKAKAAWLWSGGRGVIAGRSASALHGAKWLDARRPAELIYGNRYSPKGIRIWSDSVKDDDVELVSGMRVTTPARTALDLACRYPVGEAVALIDALANATGLKMADVEALVDRHRGRRGIKNARRVLDLVDPGAESPRETWLRLLVIRAGFPRSRTQIPVYDEFGLLVGVFDMGWDDVQVAADYEGDQHRTDRFRFNRDIRKAETVTRLGWTDIRVTAIDGEADIIKRIAAAGVQRA
ncbi:MULTISPECIES: hypothetical protein [unclassified Mycolicibacterium]|uniref:hypothetical protein n=1 Tax=unclassified Mycolicibacterium TaxID=2636767 RepID=UPI0012DC94E8|nr:MULTISPECIES: hypothetical protein [unclassified Mycolicibacterium]MUL83944.1 hypothetical protein [Mycolicibacterium sp. CBMA 329]MUL89990.1 hypothetical protein [Mycolicibacterium sp. CBMA 331]MUL97989.1 hypothetical protein [Mycolicibacterium sp. CBMA 334]MUM27921.1 hypothetical protein [Mycolicibacterium sp. CBMA 295]MUM39505.1 hypothetical protein [Mycolicibacterium sp. CBMA 247]